MREMITRKMVTDVAAMIAGQIACYYAFKVSLSLPPRARGDLAGDLLSDRKLTDDCRLLVACSTSWPRWTRIGRSAWMQRRLVTRS